MEEFISFSRSWDISVGIAKGYSRRKGVRFPEGVTGFSHPQCPDRPWGLYNLHSSDYGGSFPGVKWREADHSYPSSVPHRPQWHKA
jgi:hypothetical protein